MEFLARLAGRGSFCIPILPGCVSKVLMPRSVARFGMPGAYLKVKWAKALELAQTNKSRHKERDSGNGLVGGILYEP
jgi:hypothetical protein